jgi:hypothetical protein
MIGTSGHTLVPIDIGETRMGDPPEEILEVFFIIVGLVFVFTLALG